MFNDFNSISRAIAASAILGALTLGSPVPVAAQTSPAPAATMPSPDGATAMPRKSARARMAPAERVEARIKDLHGQLHITAAQEAQWSGVAQTMRDNAKSIEAIASERTRKIATMSAVDDLRSYESLAEAHADGMKKLVAAFAPLYDSLSDGQKKTADDLFRNRARHMPKTKKS